MSQPPTQKWQTKPARIVYALITLGGNLRGGFPGLVGLLVIVPFYRILSPKEIAFIFLGVAEAVSILLRGLAIYYGFDTRTWHRILRTFLIESCLVLALLFVLYKAYAFTSFGLG